MAGLAAAGFAKSGGLGGIIGSGKRKREEQAATVEQRERQYDYENFDFNQDVGDIYNPYAEVTKKQGEFERENLDKAQANLLDQHERAGVFGATTGVLSSSVEAGRQSAQRLSGLRAQGAQYVDQQRQSRIAQRYDQAGTFLARADERLAAAKRARTQATEQLVKGIGGAVTAAAGGIAGGAGAGADGGFSALGALKGSGLVPINPNAKAKAGAGAGSAFDQYLKPQNIGGVKIDPMKLTDTVITGNKPVGTVEVGQGGFGGPFDQGNYVAPDDTWSYGN